MDQNIEKTMKINVIGSSGSGKTTYGKRISKALDIPFIELDAIFWKPNWELSSDEEFFPKIEEALNQESWVLDGNYSRSIPIKWRDVDLVIFVDHTFIRTIYQATKRAISRIISKEELWEGSGNRETLRSLLSKDSIILWAINQYKSARTRFDGYTKDKQFSHIRFVRVRSRKELDQLLNDLKQGK